MIATNIGLELQAKAINKQSEQLELSRDGQIDERFKNAVEHLGDEKEPIILGGIVELHQIAKENQDKYSAVVFNILISYLRTHLKIKRKRDDNFSTTIPQTIIDFLFKEEAKLLYNNFRANLSFCNLLGVNISDAKFIGSDLSFCLMPHEILNTSFDDSKFGRTNFTISKLKNVSFKNTNFHDCIFNNCELEAIDFSYSNMKNVNFISTKIIELTMKKVDLYDVTFQLCYFNNLSMITSKVIKNRFLGCNLDNSFIIKNEIIKTNFIGVGFYFTVFDSEFYQCNFNGIRLKYEFEYIDIDDVKTNINKKTDKTGINIMDTNKFINCYWEDFKTNDYNLIKTEYETVVENWEQKYKTGN